MNPTNLKISFNSIILSLISSIVIKDIQDMYKVYTFIFLPLKLFIFLLLKNKSSISKTLINLFLITVLILIQFLFNSLAAGSKGETSKYNYIKYDLFFSIVFYLYLSFMNT